MVIEIIFGPPPLQLVLWLQATLRTYRVKCSGCQGFSGKPEEYTSIFNNVEQMVALSMKADTILPVFYVIDRYNVDISQSQRPLALALGFAHHLTH